MNVVVEAHAKINLSLAVGPLRDDGYHEIDTLFQTVTLCDTVELAPLNAGAVELVVVEGDVPRGPDNLAWQAAEAVMERTGCPGVRIRLTKRIPVAAGLGGGSADAAAVLVGMNVLHKISADTSFLLSLAAGIGSDVPFLVEGGTARGRGRGELLQRLPVWDECALVLVTPRIAISARDAYDWARIGLTEEDLFTRLNCSGIQKGGAGLSAAPLFNDLEAGVVAAHPEVGAVRAALLEAGALRARMSGSGPTVFGLAGSKEDAGRIVSRLGARDWTIHVVEPIDAGCLVTGSVTGGRV